MTEPNVAEAVNPGRNPLRNVAAARDPHVRPISSLLRRLIRGSCRCALRSLYNGSRNTGIEVKVKIAGKREKLHAELKNWFYIADSITILSHLLISIYIIFAFLYIVLFDLRIKIYIL